MSRKRVIDDEEEQYEVEDHPPTTLTIAQSKASDKMLRDIEKYISTPRNNVTTLVVKDVRRGAFVTKAYVTILASILMHNESVNTLKFNRFKIYNHLETITDIFYTSSHITRLELNAMTLSVRDQEALGLAIEHSDSIHTLKMKDVACQHQDIHGTFIRHLLNSKTLRRLSMTVINMHASAISVMMRQLRANKYLKHATIVFSNYQQSTDDTCHIFEKKRGNNTLEKLSIYGLSIDVRHQTALFKSLETNTTLAKLKIAGGSRYIVASDEAVSNMLCVNTTLKVLQFDSNAFDSNIHIHEALRVNTTLTTLHWGLYPEVFNVRGDTIIDAISDNTTLTDLSVSLDNGCTTAAVANMLTKNQSLTNLNASFTCESDDISLISQAYLDNSSLMRCNIKIIHGTRYFPVYVGNYNDMSKNITYYDIMLEHVNHYLHPHRHVIY